jgi:magnesium-transporting ATPase (P-type)
VEDFKNLMSLKQASDVREKDNSKSDMLVESFGSRHQIVNDLESDKDRGIDASDAELQKRREKYGENILLGASKIHLKYATKLIFKDYLAVIFTLTTLLALCMSGMVGYGKWRDYTFLLIC